MAVYSFEDPKGIIYERVLEWNWQNAFLLMQCCRWSCSVSEETRIGMTRLRVLLRLSLLLYFEFGRVVTRGQHRHHVCLRKPSDLETSWRAVGSNWELEIPGTCRSKESRGSTTRATVAASRRRIKDLSWTWNVKPINPLLLFIQNQQVIDEYSSSWLVL